MITGGVSVLSTYIWRLMWRGVGGTGCCGTETLWGVAVCGNEESGKGQEKGREGSGMKRRVTRGATMVEQHPTFGI